MTDITEKVWNVILHHAAPLTDEEDSVQVIAEDTFRQLHLDLIAVFEGKDVVTEAKTLPEPKPKPKKEKREEVVIPKVTKEEGKAMMEASTTPGIAVPVQEPEKEKKKWWQLW